MEFLEHSSNQQILDYRVRAEMTRLHNYLFVACLFSLVVGNVDLSASAAVDRDVFDQTIDVEVVNSEERIYCKVWMEGVIV